MATPNALPPAASSAHRGTFLGHPTGLFLLFLVEMWERFSYYGMRGLLVLYLTSAVTGMAEPYEGAPAGFNPGPGWSAADASNLYGWYTSLAYLFPLAGGIIADKLIGTHRSMLVGGLLISLGHVVLAVSGLVPPGDPVSMTIFVGGLALIVLGTGHFKPNVSVMVGQLYAPDDPRREGAFSIFYMGINLGAFICAYICGTLGERVGWHWGFGSAAIGMLLGLAFYMALRPRFMPGIGLPPGDRGSLSTAFLGSGVALSFLAAILFHVGVFGQLDAILSSKWVAIPLAITGAIAAIVFTLRQPLGDRGPVASIFLFMLFNVVFWLSFEQAGSSINIFTNEHTDRTIGGFEVFTTWFQSINPLLIILAAPVFGSIWVSLARRDRYVSQPAKIGTGLMLVGLGYGFMVLAALQAQHGAKAAMWLVVATYAVHTIGEIILSPTGLAYVTRAAPPKHGSLLMGIWFLSSFIANLLAGKVAAQVEKVESGAIPLPWHFGGQADFFFLFIATSCTAGVFVLVMTPLLKKLMRNPKD
jgi:POT family proton-dependent oligopeptide transporter